MKVPIVYHPHFVDDPERTFVQLRDELSWEQRDAPRQEYYCNDVDESYVYGQGRGRRLYEPQPWHSTILTIRDKLSALANVTFEVCFLNRYVDQSKHLGWHADDSPEMDDTRPIGIVSLGVEREIWFAPKIDGQPSRSEIERVTLENGSLCLMKSGMQDTWMHRIPKASFACGERISLTFRGYVGIT